jgi:hydroxyethylthiazole kinase
VSLLLKNKIPFFIMKLSPEISSPVQYTHKGGELSVALDNLRTRAPLIHCITNYVSIDFVANALKSIGASPIMSYATEEMNEIIKIADALIINIGTFSAGWSEGMNIAATAANKKGIPIVLDPVGAGATSYRTAISKQILKNHHIWAIRGNASEIMALIDQKSKTKGVDAIHSTHEPIEAAHKLSQKHSCIVIVSGKTDYVIEADRSIQINGGDPMMANVVGTGCVSSAIMSAFLATKNGDSIEAAAHGMAAMKKATELAAQNHPREPASFKMEFTDALYTLHANI